MFLLRITLIFSLSKLIHQCKIQSMGNVIEKCCEGEKQIPRNSKKVLVPADPTKTNNHLSAENSKKFDEQFSLMDKPTDANEETISDDKIAKILDKKAKIKKKMEFQDFQIDGVLGSGGFGKVYLGQLKENIANEIVEKYAIKKVEKKFLIKKKVYANAIDEKNILAMYQCKFIVTLIMAFQDPWFIYFVMQCATGGDTYSLIRKGSLKVPQYKSLGETAVRFIAGCVILGLEFLHKKNYMYRDLKPENVLLFENGYAKLTDFGLAKKSLEGVTNKTISGTQIYYAPEMVLKKGYDKEVDIWTLGVYLYQLSIFQPPFTKEQMTRSRFQAVCLEAESNRSWKNANPSPQLKDLINNLLRFEPSKRIGAKGWNEVKQHAFFKGFDWKALESMEMESPLKDLVRKYPVRPKPYQPDPPNMMKDATDTQKLEGWTYMKDG